MGLFRRQAGNSSAASLAVEAAFSLAGISKRIKDKHRSSVTESAGYLHCATEQDLTTDSPGEGCGGVGSR
jgi:hypothetical protein